MYVQGTYVRSCYFVRGACARTISHANQTTLCCMYVHTYVPAAVHQLLRITVWGGASQAPSHANPAHPDVKALKEQIIENSTWWPSSETTMQNGHQYNAWPAKIFLCYVSCVRPIHKNGAPPTPGTRWYRMCTYMYVPAVWVFGFAAFKGYQDTLVTSYVKIYV